MSTNISTPSLNAAKDPFGKMPKSRKPAKGPKDAPAIQLGEHSRYQVKSGWLAGQFVARAFPKPPTKARGMIAEATGATEDAAIAALHAALDTREEKRTGDRRGDTRTGIDVPSTEEYAEAVAQVALSGPQKAMLTALALAEDAGLTGQQIANAAGYKSQASANRALIASGQLLATYLAVELPTELPSGAADGTVFLGFRDAQPEDEDAGNWVLYPELRDAVRFAL